jgi:hypothetical protein
MEFNLLYVSPSDSLYEPATVYLYDSFLRTYVVDSLRYSRSLPECIKHLPTSHVCSFYRESITQILDSAKLYVAELEDVILGVMLADPNTNSLYWISVKTDYRYIDTPKGPDFHSASIGSDMVRTVLNTQSPIATRFNTRAGRKFLESLICQNEQT